MDNLNPNFSVRQARSLSNGSPGNLQPRMLEDGDNQRLLDEVGARLIGGGCYLFKQIKVAPIKTGRSDGCALR